MLNTIRNLYELPAFGVVDQLASLDDFIKQADESIQSTLQLLPKKVLIRCLNTLVGIEVEVENCEGSTPGTPWKMIEDHSLRNTGREFITHRGIRAHTTYKALQNICKVAMAYGWVASDRTSIHVHINVNNMTLEEVNGMLILYSVFEDSLFSYAGSFRFSNIFCVPLSEQAQKNSNTFQEFLGESQKYSALNTLCVRDKGTVEFRQMQTNFDPDYIFKWVLMLCMIRYYARFNSLDDIKKLILSIKTTSQYHNLLSEVFHGLAKDLPINEGRMDDLASDSKLLFFGDYQ